MENFKKQSGGSNLKNELRLIAPENAEGSCTTAGRPRCHKTAQCLLLRFRGFLGPKKKHQYVQ